MVLAAFAVAAVIVCIALIAPRVGNIVGGATGIHDGVTLPDHIGVCGRHWSKQALGRASSLSEIRARIGIEPVVVDPGPFAPCPVGPCTRVAESVPCHTVVYVRVGEDSYLAYSLQGGP
jgi:hypothetical protein